RPAECNDREFKGNKKKGCGIVTAKEMAFTTLVVVDQRFDVKLKLSPEQTIPEATLKEITDALKPVRAIGSLQKNDTFRVDWYEIEDGPNASPATAPTGTTTATVTVTTTPTVVTTAPLTVTPTPNTTVTYSIPAPAQVLTPGDIQKLVDEDL